MTAGGVVSSPSRAMSFRASPPSSRSPSPGSSCSDDDDEILRVIRAEIARLVRIARADVEAHMRQHEAATENLKLQHGPKARLGKPITPERAENSLGFIRRNDLDWIFFRRWRLAEGWLASEAQARALDIFHDPLAIQMRRSVLSELHPDLPVFSK